MEISAIDKFFLEIFKTNKVYVEERWAEWEALVKETLKAEVEKKYPNGFKDFLVAKMEVEIKQRTINIKKYEKQIAKKISAKAE